MQGWRCTARHDAADRRDAKAVRAVAVRLRCGLAAAMLTALATGGSAQVAAPDVLIDHGACPFECCRYGAWTTTRPTPAYAAPYGQGPKLVTIAAGVTVTALTGQVRSRARRFVVHRRHGRYQPGDQLMVYGYQGEGQFTVWFDGASAIEDLGFSPYGGSGGPSCTDRRTCWGTLARPLQSQWSAQLRLTDGRTAWVDGHSGFDGQNACSVPPARPRQPPPSRAPQLPRRP